jgi:fibronectin-binding autotransporter adhesin
VATGTISETFITQLGGTNDAVVYAWKASRFSGIPITASAAPSGDPDAGPVQTGQAFGGPGEVQIATPTNNEAYYIQYIYNHVNYWQLTFPLGGGSGSQLPIYSDGTGTISLTETAGVITLEASSTVTVESTLSTPGIGISISAPNAAVDVLCGAGGMAFHDQSGVGSGIGIQSDFGIISFVTVGGVGGVNFTNGGTGGITLSNTGDGSTSVGGNGISLDDTGGDGIGLYSTGGISLSGTTSVGIGSSGGMTIDDTSTSGLQLNETGNGGITITNTGTDPITITDTSAGGSGVTIQSSNGTVELSAPGAGGEIALSSASSIAITAAGTMNIHATNNADTLQITAAGELGIISGISYLTLDAGAGAGVWINSSVGAGASGKLGFFGTAPVVQQSSSGVTTVAGLITLLKNYGFLS